MQESAWAVTKYAIGKLDYVDCIVYLINDKGELYQCAAHGNKNPNDQFIQSPIKLEIGEGISGNVALTGVGEIINDTSKDSRYRVDDELRLSEISVPILLNGIVIGVIDSEHPEKDYFTQHDLDVLNTIASMLSVKISQANAIEELAMHKAALEERIKESTKELQETIVRLQESNEEITRHNIEKETMLREIHHRVKNNLQIMSSLLNMQANKTDSSDNQVFADCQNRIAAMSMIHNQLYNKENLSEIDTKKYIEELSAELITIFQSNNKIELNLDLDQILLDIELSIPFGLILNELIVNAIKHGFQKDFGTLTIKLKKLKESVELIVSDNGVGFVVERKKESMGMELIQALTSQLDGSLHFDSNNKGTTCTVRFPLQ